jgi:hypothetical protein
MGKRSVGKKCVYCCSAPSTTEDHIFARQFFLVTNRDNLPKVPACGRCNGRKSRLEHYLTSVLPFGGHHKAATDTVMESVTRRFPKNQKLSREFLRSLRPAWVQEGAGLVLPTASFKFDSSKLAVLLKMIARGLAWYHWKSMVPPDYYADVLFMPDMVTVDFQDRVRSWNAERRISIDLGDGTIRYEGVQMADPHELTVWGFTVFGGVAVAYDRSRDGGPIQSSSRWWVITAPPEVGKNFNGPLLFGGESEFDPTP